MPESNWNEWANYVLKEIERLSELTCKIPLIEKDIAILQLKAGMWGALAGALITTIGGIIIAVLTKK